MEQHADRGCDGRYQKAQSESDCAVGEIGRRRMAVIQVADRDQRFDPTFHERVLTEAGEDRADREKTIGARTEDRGKNGEQGQPENLLRGALDGYPRDRRQGSKAS